MEKRILMIVLISILGGYISYAQSPAQDNPLFQQWKTPFQTPPFDAIKVEHFLPAFEEGMRLENTEIDAIITNKEKPSFQNTIVALEKSGKFLSRVSRIFWGLNGANTNDEIQKIAREITPALSKHGDDINLNAELFARVNAIYANKDKLKLTTEENTLLNNFYKGFIRNGANLSDMDKQKLREINEELSMLGLKFGENLLKETNAVGLIVENKEDLAGLPENVIQAAAEMANRKGMEGKWAFTLQKPSFIPFLQYSQKRALRELLFNAYINRGNNDNEFDNKAIISRIAALRVKRANLLGYKTHADFVLEENMAKTTANVMKFLNDLWQPALKRAEVEIADMQTIINKEESNPFKLEAWDWMYYAEKVKREKYALDEEMLRPYFKMENVLEGAFMVANRLYGITFTPRTDIQTWNADVRAFEVKEADGKHIGIFYADYFPRDGKRSGAWSSSFRSQSNIDGNFITPLVYNVGNFSKPTTDEPSLMNLDEVETLFHELGHGLDALFSNTIYSGSRDVPRDFVELPSQIMENWAFEPEVLKLYAKHYQTGEPIPPSLVDKIVQSAKFNQGFATVEYLAASFLDMQWHTLSDTVSHSTPQLEDELFTRIGLINEIKSRYLSTNFSHIVGGYASGYYSYIWAEVLDSDAFEAFKETELFNSKLAALFRQHILAKGGTEDGMVLYKRFRGAEPKVDALLKKRGLN